MGEEACSDRRATPQISTTDVFPNTPSPGRTKKYSWMLMCTVWWCLLEHILSAGISYYRVHQDTSADSTSLGTHSLSEVNLADSGFVNSTEFQMKYITTSNAAAISYQIMSKSTDGTFLRTPIRSRTQTGCTSRKFMCYLSVQIQSDNPAGVKHLFLRRSG